MGIECGECERDLRGGHDPSCSRYRPCVCPFCLASLEDGDGYLWCREHGEVSPLENRMAVATIARLTAELAQSQAEVAAAYDQAAVVCLADAQRRRKQAADLAAPGVVNVHNVTQYDRWIAGAIALEVIVGKLHELATEHGTTALAEMLDAETRACAEVALRIGPVLSDSPYLDGMQACASQARAAILARIDQRKEAGA